MPWRAILFFVAAMAACTPRAAEPPLPRVALFEHPWVWTDEEGMVTSFARWRGSTLVLAPIYTSCSQVCPLTIGKLRRVQEALLREGRAAEFVLLTFDPAADTPERLRRFKRSEQLPAAWHLLRGSPASTQELLDLLDIHFIDMGSHIVHEPRISVFDGKGVLARSFRGIDFDESAL